MSPTSKPDDFAARWKTSPLERWSIDVLESVGLSAEAAEFLRSAGLPKATRMHGWVFGGDFLTLPRVADLLRANGRPCPLPLVRSYAVGADKWGERVASWIVVDPAPDSHVHLVAAVGESPGWGFLNASVPQLAECLLACHLLQETAETEGDDIFSELLRRSIELIDPEALAAPENFWSIAVEEASHGM